LLQQFPARYYLVAVPQLFMLHHETYFCDMEPGLYSAMMNVTHYIVGQTFLSTSYSQFKRICLPATYAAETNRSTWNTRENADNADVTVGKKQGHEGYSPASANSTSRSRLGCQVNLPRFIKEDGEGHAVAQLVEVLRYKPEGCVFDFFIDVILPTALSPSVRFSL
jgi:hypothetical protein